MNKRTTNTQKFLVRILLCIHMSTRKYRDQEYSFKTIKNLLFISHHTEWNGTSYILFDIHSPTTLFSHTATKKPIPSATQQPKPKQSPKHIQCKE